MSKQQMRIVLVGLGKHSMRTYWSFFELLKEQTDFSVVALVDLVSNKKVINNFIEKSFIKPEQYIFLENKEDTSSLQALKELDTIYAKERIDKIIIATEPCSHGIYIDWALSHDIEILVEKPVIAFVDMNLNKEKARNIERYVTNIATKDTNARISVQTQRRYNAAYAFTYSYVKEFIKEFKVPISFLSVHHEDGLWNSIQEFSTEEAHPYKYGYGKLLHSGYHYIDLFCWFSQLNTHANGKDWADEMSLSTEIFRPIDLANQLRSLRALQKPYVTEKNNVSHTLGEIDCYNSFQFKKSGFVVMIGRVDMMQNSVSSRTNFDDVYTGKHDVGVRKYEEVSIYVGPLLKLRIYTVSKENDKEYYFRVEVSKNAALVGGKDVEIFDFKQEYGAVPNSIHGWTPNKIARFRLFDAFLSGRENISKIASHVDTNRMISLMYQNITASQTGKIPYSKIHL